MCARREVVGSEGAKVQRCSRSLLFCATFLGIAAYAQAQTVISPARSIDWSRAGVSGDIPTRSTQCGSTIPAYSGTAATINTAIQNCPAGQFVQLGAGTFTLSTGIDFSNKSNVTLRGMGPSSTILSFTGRADCGGVTGLICVESGTLNFTPGGEQNIANWTAGYAVGTTTITLSNTANLAVGSVLILDQANDGNTDRWPDVWVCEAIGVCSDEGGAAGRPGRAQHQLVTVTSINGSTVGISPGLYMPNWRSGQNPMAWWANGLPITGVGIESLRLNAALPCASPVDLRGVITFFNATNSWVKNVMTYNACRAHVMFFQSSHITVRNSYSYSSQNYASQSYGFEWYLSDDNLVENNIMHHVTGIMEQSGGAGNVVAYNYLFDDYYTVSPTYMQAAIQQHSAGNNFNLSEGNDTTGLKADGVHGTSQFITWFRNRVVGWEPGKAGSTVPVQVYAFNEFFNVIGNVLGQSRYHTSYAGTQYTSIYDLGSSAGRSPADNNVALGIYRWGNWDTVTNATRWCTSVTSQCTGGSEVPTALSLYGQLAPLTQTLPASLYLAAKPSWFGSATYPPIGPDVTGGNIPDVGGHANKIPARVCYENTAKDGSGMLIAFNANNCYAAGGNPRSPTNLRIMIIP